MSSGLSGDPRQRRRCVLCADEKSCPCRRSTRAQASLPMVKGQEGRTMTPTTTSATAPPHPVRRAEHADRNDHQPECRHPSAPASEMIEKSSRTINRRVPKKEA